MKRKKKIEYLFITLQKEEKVQLVAALKIHEKCYSIKNDSFHLIISKKNKKLKIIVQEKKRKTILTLY